MGQRMSLPSLPSHMGAATSPASSLPDLLSGMLPKVRIVFVRELWACIKNGSQTMVSGWLAEAWFIELCRTLEPFGIRTIRGAESSMCDGAWIWDPASCQDLPPPGCTSLEMYEWVTDHPGTELVYFEVKYFGLRPSAKHELDYGFSDAGGHQIKKDAAVYAVVIESVTDYVALIPKYVYEKSTDFGYGVEPLICGMPAWCLLYLVHVDDLKEAILGLLDARHSTSKWYRNPTTGLEFHGWIPQKLADPRSLTPSQAGKITSMHAVLHLFAMMKAQGWNMDFNPVSPLVCDFWIWCDSVADPQLREPIFIEHKTTGNSFFAGIDSPFTLDRQWHFLICSHPDTKKIFCCAKQSVHESWTEQENLDEDVYNSFCHDSVESLLEYIKSNVKNAVLEAERCNLRPGERNLDSIISREAREAAEHSATTGTNRPTEAHAPKDRLFHAKALPWVCLALNNLLAERGDFVCYPTDPYHPSGADHLVVDHTWSTEDKANLKWGMLPLSPLTGRGGSGSRAKSVPMRFADLSPGAVKADPIILRPSYWTRLCPDIKGVMLLGAVLPPEVYTRKASDASKASLGPYLLLPGQLLKSYDSDELRVPVPDPDTEAECNRRDESFFSFTKQATTELLPSVTKTRQAMPIAKLVKPGVEPFAHIIDLHLLPGILFELIRGPGTTMRIQSPLIDTTTQETPEFTKAENLTTVEAFYQAAWDYSLWRKPASLEGKPAARQPAPPGKSRARDPEDPRKGGTHRKNLGKGKGR